MVAPIDYGVQIADPTQAFLSAFNTGASIQEAQFKQQQQQQQAAQQQLIQAGFKKLQQPGATAADYANLAMMLPETQAKSVRESFNMLSGERQQTALRQSGEVFSAFKSGKPEIAITLLDQQIEGKRNAGDEAGAKFLETWRDVAKENPKATEDYFGFTISQIPGGDKVITSAIALEGERRAQAKQPFEVRKLTAETIVEEQKAKYAPEKFGLEINLTQSQIDQAKAAMRASDAAAKKSGAEATRAEAEAAQMAIGVIPADKRPEVEGKFRTEYNTQTKPYQEVKSAYGRMLASEDTAVGDLSLIFGYMKMLDPGSVVREGEFATAQNAAGVPERIMNVYNRLISGERLNASQRNSFKGQAKGLYNSALEGEKTVRTGLERIATGYGLNTNNIFYTPAETAPVAQTSLTVTPLPPPPAPPPAPAPAPAAATPPAAGQRNITVDY
jgi:hypothetical protein